MKTIIGVGDQEKGNGEHASDSVSYSEISQESNFNESDNLIVCNSELASSLQDIKLEKSRLNPGHYIHKVFLHKLKSQSVPSLEKKKTNYLENGGSIPEENNETVSPLIDQESTNDEENNWFKTWPDCVDKCSLKNGKVSNGLHSPENSSDKSTPELSPVKPHTPVTFDNLLHNLPLAYSPITKQIHIIKSNENPKLELETAEEKPFSRVGTDVSLFSSNVSSLSDVSPSTNEDSVSGSLLDHGDDCSLVSIGNCSITSEESGGTKPKRKGISSFFSRGVFGWKGKSDAQCNGESWSIFGKSQINHGRSSSSLDRYSEDGHSVDSSRGVLGSTGLIQLERPAWLPAKSKQEHQAHSDQHEKIIHSARKRELKEAKQRKKLLQSQLKVEDELAHATKVWTHEILPKWHQTRNQRRTLDMWWQGVPPCVRGKLWCLAISNDLNITHELYEICVSRAQERLNSAMGSTDSVCDTVKDVADKEASLELIQLDISRTFPHLCIFQKGGPYYDMLHCLLAAYACYRPDVGYVQGMSFIAAILILNMDAPDAFICFANILNRPCHRAFYSLDQPLMGAYYSTYKDILKENLPTLSNHMVSCKLTPDLYLLDWLYTVFAKAMNLDLTSRIWDVFLRDGEEFLFRTAIGILHLYEECLMGMDFLAGSKFLTRLPDDLSSVQLFKSISSVRMTVSKRTFCQILSTHIHSPG